MEQREFTFKEDEFGTPIKADVFFTSTPEGSPSGRPIAIMIHGGGFVIGSKDMIPRWQIERLVQKHGFVTVCPDYRLCPTTTVHDGPLQDSKDCYLWAQEKLPQLLSNEIQIDGQKVVTVGYSAGGTLALLLAAMPTPPVAILDFYGPLAFKDPFWHSPLPALAKIPPFDETFLATIYSERPPVATETSLEKRTQSGGMPTFDFSDVRNAWLFDAMKKGTHFKTIVGDGIYDRVDPLTLFSVSYPPTCFVHGNKDDMVDVKFSQQGFETLRDLGVETEIHYAEGQNHAFDRLVDEQHSCYPQVSAGIDFLARHV